MFGFRNPEDFFTLYQETCRTVKEICPEFRFGTPGMLLLPDDPMICSAVVFIKSSFIPMEHRH